jgi:hypothetical protein
MKSYLISFIMVILKFFTNFKNYNIIHHQIRLVFRSTIILSLFKNTLKSSVKSEYKPYKRFINNKMNVKSYNKYSLNLRSRNFH